MSNRRSALAWWLVGCSGPAELPDTGLDSETPALGTVSGVISENGAVTFTPIDGARVSIVDADPELETQTDADGAWSLEVPHGTWFVRANEPGFATFQGGVVVDDAGGTVDLQLIPQVAVDGITAVLGYTLDPDRGEVIVTFDTTVDGGFGAALSAGHDDPFTFTASGTGQRSDVTVTGGEDRLIWPNVVVGVTTATPSPPAGSTCVPVEDIAEYRIDPGVTTEIDLRCTP